MFRAQASPKPVLPSAQDALCAVPRLGRVPVDVLRIVHDFERFHPVQVDSVLR